MTTTIIMLLFSLLSFCPKGNTLVIFETRAIQPYEKLIYAVGSVECSYDTLAYNVKEKAAGYFQIRPIRIDDYNKRTGNHYTTIDMFDYYKAEKVFLYYANQIGPYNLEKIAKSWNGSGPKTIEYWKLIKEKL